MDATTLEKERHAATSMGDQSFALLTVPKLMESWSLAVTSTVALLSALMDAKTLEIGGKAVLSTVALLSALMDAKTLEKERHAATSMVALLSARVTV
jgi:hypothetical protein